jgi:hypothetical protein
MDNNLELLNSESGMATLEMLPLVIVFMVFIAYMLGMYGITHTAILNSIGARNYAFEITRHRADLTYLRSNGMFDGTETRILSYKPVGTRSFAVIGESESDNGKFPATVRKIAMGLDSSKEEIDRQPATVHNENGGKNVYTIKDNAENTDIKVRDVWIMTRYGICLDAKCGDNK